MLYGSSDMLDGMHGGGGSDGPGDLWVKAGQGEAPPPPESSYQPYDSRLPSGYYYQDDYQGLNEDVMNLKNREHLRESPSQLPLGLSVLLLVLRFSRKVGRVTKRRLVFSARPKLEIVSLRSVNLYNF